MLNGITIQYEVVEDTPQFFNLNILSNIQLPRNIPSFPENYNETDKGEYLKRFGFHHQDFDPKYHGEQLSILIDVAFAILTSMIILKKLQSESTFGDIDNFNNILLWRNQMLLRGTSEILGDEIKIGNNNNNNNNNYSSVANKYNFPFENNIILPEEDFKNIFEVILKRFWSI